MAEEDDDGFGDFEFAPSNPTVYSHSNTTLINGHHSISGNDDDDWGDFINSSAGQIQSPAVSFPEISKSVEPFGLFSDQKPGNEDSLPSRPSPAKSHWEKPRGALPLSIFGELEEEENEKPAAALFGDGAASFISSNNKVDSVKKEPALDVNDLLVNLYQKSDSKNGPIADINVSSSDLKMNVVNLAVAEFNLNVKNELEMNPKKLSLDWDPLNFNSFASNSNQNGTDFVKRENSSDIGANLVSADANEVLYNGDGDDDGGWEFKDAKPKIPTSNEISKMSPIKTENGLVSNLNGLNSSWNSPSLDFNGWNHNIVQSATNSVSTDPVPDNGEADDDEGWEFKGADFKVHVGDDKDSQTKTEHMTVLNINLSGSSWGAFPSNFSALNASEVKSEDNWFSANLIDEKKDSTSANGWFLNGAEQKHQIKAENGPALGYNANNSTANAFSLDGSANSNLNGMNLESKQANFNLFDEYGDDNDEWEFNTAAPAHGPQDGNAKGEVTMPENFEAAQYTFGFGNGINGESNYEFDFNSNYENKLTEGIERLHDSPVDIKIGSDENSWAFEDAVSETGSKDKGDLKVAEGPHALKASVLDAEVVQGSVVRTGNHKGALPLSIFGDEGEQSVDPVIFQDISTQVSTSGQRAITSSVSNVSINDLISSLYSQAELSNSFKNDQNISENGLDSNKAMMTSNLENLNHDFDDDSWEFQDASTGHKAEDQTGVLELGVSLTQHNTQTKLNGYVEFHDTQTELNDYVEFHNSQTELNDYVEFFTKLKEGLHAVALHHLENLKKAQSALACTGEDDVDVQALDKEIQELNAELHQSSIISSEVYSETGNMCLGVFVEVLKQPKFYIFESECQLTKKLSLAESDLRSAIELLKYVDVTLKILTLLPREDQFSYISVWSKMLAVCAQELRHGALIWKQSAQVNVQDQILSKPQGKKCILALGEIYRIVEVLGSSARLYKPWILASSTNSTSIYTLLSECSSLWLNSGLEEALQSILSSADFEYDENLKTLPESIKYIHGLDVHTLYNNVYSGQGSICRLSALTTVTVPGMKTIVWNGESYFLTLANLWANLISIDPPNLPSIHVG